MAYNYTPPVQNYFVNPGHYQVSLTVTLNGFGNWHEQSMPQQPQGYLEYNRPHNPNLTYYLPRHPVHNSPSDFSSSHSGSSTSRDSSFGVSSDSNYGKQDMYNVPSGYYSPSSQDTQSTYGYPKTSSPKPQSCFSRCAIQ